MKIHHENIIKSYSINRKDRLHKRLDHWHQRAEFIYILEGTCTVRIGGTSYSGSAGDLFAVHSGEIHSIENADPCPMYICLFDPTILYSFQTELKFIKRHIQAQELKNAGLDEEVLRIFREMLQEQQNGALWHEVIIRTDILRLYSLLVRHFEREVSPDNRSMTKFYHFQKVLAYIAEHYAENINLASIAATINYHPSYVSTLFVTYTGVNFKAYLDSFRINQAVELLRSTNQTITDIAAHCGYENIRTFNYTFKRVTGTTPSLVRKENI